MTKAMIDPRQRAKSLNAATVESLFSSSLQFVLSKLTASQVQQIQRVLDAAVVDPVIKQEADALYQRALTRYGSLVVEDQAMIRRSERVMQTYIWVKASDNRVRLDYKALLTSDALTPRTDNPDEAEYLERVRRMLESRGVWLRFDKKFIRDPDDMSRRILSPRHFEAWLTLGPEGDGIPSKTGRLDREALLGTTVLGAGYYDDVHQGLTQSALEKVFRNVTDAIESVEEQHSALAKIRRDAPIGVVGISDFFGGAKFPNASFVAPARRLLMKALEFNVGGFVYGSRALLIAAATCARSAAVQLSVYIDDTSSGAERAVITLKVVVVVTAVVEIALGYGLVRRAGSAAAAQAGKQVFSKFAAQNPEFMVDLYSIEWVPVGEGRLANLSYKYGSGF